MDIQSLRTDDCIDEVIEKYSDMVYRLAYSRVKSKSDADDIFQEVFLRYINKKRVFENEEHRKAWFISLVLVVCLVVSLFTTSWVAAGNGGDGQGRFNVANGVYLDYCDGLANEVGAVLYYYITEKYSPVLPGNYAGMYIDDELNLVVLGTNEEAIAEYRKVLTDEFINRKKQEKMTSLGIDKLLPGEKFGDFTKEEIVNAYAAKQVVSYKIVQYSMNELNELYNLLAARYDELGMFNLLRLEQYNCVTPYVDTEEQKTAVFAAIPERLHGALKVDVGGERPIYFLEGFKASDLLAVKKHLLSITPLNVEQTDLYDFDKNGVLNAKTLLAIKKVLLGIPVKYPVINKPVVIIPAVPSDIEFEIITDKSSYRLDEKMTVTVKATNISDRIIYTVDGTTSYDANGLYISVGSPENKFGFYDDLKGLATNDAMYYGELLPGQTITRQRVFDLSDPYGEGWDLKFIEDLPIIYITAYLSARQTADKDDWMVKYKKALPINVEPAILDR